MRVLKVNKLDDNQYPLQGGSTFGKDDPGLSEALGNQEPTLEDQGAKPVEVSDQEGDYRDEFQLSTANAVHDDSWLAFMRHIKDREGWHEYAGCHVNVKRDSEAYVSPIDKFSVEDFPYRTTCHWKDDAWFILDPFFLWPKYEGWNEAVATCEAMFTIFSQDISDLRVGAAEEIKLDEDIPGDDPLDKEIIEVSNPATGIVEKIKRDDPQYCSADGFKTRRCKGSSKPMDIPSFV